MKSKRGGARGAGQGQRVWVCAAHGLLPRRRLDHNIQEMLLVPFLCYLIRAILACALSIILKITPIVLALLNGICPSCTLNNPRSFYSSVNLHRKFSKANT